MLTNEYLKRVYEGLAVRNASEPEFLQAVREVLERASSPWWKSTQYEANGLIERLGGAGARHQLPCALGGSSGQGTVLGYRVQFNSAIGPYKGGLRFHPSVNQGILKFFGFEQDLQKQPDHPAHGRRQRRL